MVDPARPFKDRKTLPEPLRGTIRHVEAGDREKSLNWREIRMRKWEAHMRERAARGEAPCAWKATVDSAQAARAQEETVAATVPSGTPLASDGGLLRRRLRATRLERKLALAHVAGLFGVTRQALSTWELGPKADNRGRIRGKPIPRELVPLVWRWVETGVLPSQEELAARRTARTGVGKGRRR